MKDKGDDGKNRLLSHGGTGKGNQPVKDRSQSPVQIDMIVNDAIFFAAQTKQKSHSDQQPADKKDEGKPQGRAG